MGRAELHRELQLAFPDVHGDDAAGVQQFGSHNHIQAHAAAAHHGHRAAGLHLGAEQGGSHAGRHAAANHRRLGHRQGGSRRHDPGFGNYGIFGKAGHFAHVVNILPVLVQAGGAVQHKGAGSHVQIAQIGTPGQAGFAAPAGRDKG